MGITSNGYPYIDSLLHLERYRPHPNPTHVEGFLPLEAWDLFLNYHPDREFADFLHRGIANGFRIGYRTAPHSCLLKQAPGKHKSVHANPDEVDKYILAEVSEGRLFKPQSATDIHVNPISIIPKPHQPGKFRLIVDLSAPAGGSENDGISAELCSVKYANVDSAIQLLKQSGRGALMAKLDLKSAYRMVPVHELDRPLLGRVGLHRQSTPLRPMLRSTHFYGHRRWPNLGNVVLRDRERNSLLGRLLLRTGRFTNVPHIPPHRNRAVQHAGLPGGSK